MDALSEALQRIRITAAIFHNAEFHAPWGDVSPAAADVAPALAPGTETLVIFHLVTRGHAVARIEGVPDMPLEAGDIVIIPHGDRHILQNGSPATFVADDGAALRKFLAGDLSVSRYGEGNGEVTRMVCGYFGCDRQASQMFLAGLPPMFKINVRHDSAGEWLENSITHLVCEAESPRPGRMILLAKMAEALFVEALRRYAATLPSDNTGWLAGSRDPVVGAALAAIHRNTHRHWTLADLAAAVSSSRTVLSERFQHFLGESPMAYIARWRLERAARQLHVDGKSILEIAMDVGYESEAAFNRAFKREFGLPPAQYRRSVAQRDMGAAG